LRVSTDDAATIAMNAKNVRVLDRPESRRAIPKSLVTASADPTSELVSMF